VIEPGRNFSLVDLIAQLELPEKIDQLELAVNRLRSDRMLGTRLNRQNVVFELDSQIIWLDPRQVG
jgi:hypothetical protein